MGTSPMRGIAALTLALGFGAVAFGTVDAQFYLLPSMPAFNGMPTQGVAISADGTTIAGNAGPLYSPTVSFKWTVGSTPITLVGLKPEGPTLPAPPPEQAVAISADGTVIGGQAGFTYIQASSQDPNSHLYLYPELWHQTTASNALGLNGFGGDTLLRGMSADGKSFVSQVTVTQGPNITTFPIADYQGQLNFYNNPVFGSITFDALSPNGKYALAFVAYADGIDYAWAIYDMAAKTLTVVPNSFDNANWQFFAIDNQGNMLNFWGSSLQLIDKNGNVARNMGTLPGTHFPLGATMSADDSVVVGYGDAGSFIWTAATGTTPLKTALSGKVAGLTPGVANGTDTIVPLGVSVNQGNTYLTGYVSGPDFAQPTAYVVSMVTTQRVGLPVDLMGTYLSAPNQPVVATTDPNGVVGSSGHQVLDPAPLIGLSPFSTTFKNPAPLSGLNLTGHSYWFNVDLGDPANWPNPSSLMNYLAGRASLGYTGAEFVVRASASTAQGISNADHDGLLLSFFQKDSRYWAHVTNLWYDQDIDIPVGSGVTQYHVQVSTAAAGQVTITISEASDPTQNVVTVLSGGSTDQVGLTSAGFLAAMYSMTPPTQAASTPAAATLSAFGTDAVANALYLWSDHPYLTTHDDANGILGSLNAANLTAPMTGYQASAGLFFGTTQHAISAPYGFYDAPTVFNQALSTAFAPDSHNTFNHAQTVLSGQATQADTQLETYTSPFPGGAASVGSITWQPFALYHGGPAASTIFRGPNSALTTHLVGSNATMIDAGSATLTLSRPQGNHYVLAGQTVTLQAQMSGLFGSGLAGFPVLTVSPVDPSGNALPAITVPMGIQSTTGPIFAGSFTVPAGAQSMSCVASVSSRAGVMIQSSAVSVLEGISTEVRIVGSNIPAGQTVSRVLRVVLDGLAQTPTVIIKVVTFNDVGVAQLQLTDADGLPYPANTHYNVFYVKDPYHTRGKRSAMSVTGGMYEVGAQEITLMPGDANNDNVVDVNDLAIYATLLGEGAYLPANSTQIHDFSNPLPLADINTDFNADGTMDDSAAINAYLGTAGDLDPAISTAPPPPATKISSAQALALGMPAWIIQAVDTNHDGVLTAAEILAWIHKIGG